MQAIARIAIEEVLVLFDGEHVPGAEGLQVVPFS